MCLSGGVWLYAQVPDFNCPVLTAPPPASDVRHLHPGNVGALMALGDSITAGFGMLGVEPLEFRGDVYSTGGNRGAKTLLQYVHHYNQEVTGGCTGTTIPLTKKGKGLNFAVSGAKVQDVSDQIKWVSLRAP